MITSEEKEKLTRIGMKVILEFLTPKDFGMPDDRNKRINYIVPYLGRSGEELFDTYYNKLSEKGKAWVDRWWKVWLYLGFWSINENELIGAEWKMKQEIKNGRK